MSCGSDSERTQGSNRGALHAPDTAALGHTARPTLVYHLCQRLSAAYLGGRSVRWGNAEFETHSWGFQLKTLSKLLAGAGRTPSKRFPGLPSVACERVMRRSHIGRV